MVGACRTAGQCECVFGFPVTYRTRPTVTITRVEGFFDRTYGNVPATVLATESGSVIFKVTHASYVVGSLYTVSGWFNVAGEI